MMIISMFFNRTEKFDRIEIFSVKHCDFFLQTIAKRSKEKYVENRKKKIVEIIIDFPIKISVQNQTESFLIKFLL